MDNKNYFNHLQLKLLIVLTVIINFSGVLCPIIRNDDPTLYANIAKHMVLSGDWLDLMFNQVDWLDKPHLPFWLTALSFKVFGINTFAYILPGFIFHLIGAYYTYRLAIALYDSEDVGLIAALIYLSALHLLMSSIDVRAEAYLLGSIMGACYYWYRYNENPAISLKYLILGAIFTGMALMTKGLFVLVTITSGLIFVWAYTGQLINLIKPKWLLALALSLLMTVPEVYALYIQFDSHPEKIVFAHTHVSGIRWFFWDSQFGRFFSTGPITVNHVQDFHYLFFIHTFLWAFLPWSIIFLFAVWVNIRGLRGNFSKVQKIHTWYLIGSFLPTFVLFSCTKFQLDHYTNIIMPFAAIICANWFFMNRVEHPGGIHPLFYFQRWFSYTLILAVALLSLSLFGDFSVLFIIAVVLLLAFILLRKEGGLSKSILYPVLAINLTFLLLMQVNQIAVRYDLGYQAAAYINKLNTTFPVIDYNVDSLSLELHSDTPYMRVKTADQLVQLAKPYYLVIKTEDIKTLDIKNVKVLTTIPAATIDKVLGNLLNQPKLDEDLVNYSVILID